MRKVAPLHPQAVSVMERMAVLDARLKPPVTLDMMRNLAAEKINILAPVPPPVGRIRDIAVGASAVPCRLYYPTTEDLRQSPVIVMIHGGGFAVGDLDMLQTISCMLCSALGVTVLSVDYRLAPENKFPAALDDVVAVLTWIETEGAREGLDPDRVALFGESAGGNLAASASSAVADRPGLKVIYQVLAYPVLDLTMSHPSYEELATGYPLTTEKMKLYRQMYLTQESEARDPRASPLLARSVADQPPTLLIAAGLDPLVDEGIAFVERLRIENVDAELVEVPDYPHGFLGWLQDSDAARMVMELITDRLHARFDKAAI